jgi:hypothetical protein
MPELVATLNPGSNALLYAGNPDTQLVQAPSLGRLAEYHRAAAGNSRDAVNLYRAARPLPEDAQRMLDNALIRVGRKKLVIVEDLLNAGLTFDLPNWLAVPTLQWDRVNDGGNARRSMVPKARGQRFVLDRTPATLPVYCTWGDFSFDIRTLLAAERAGYNIDTAHAEAATRKVNEFFEDQAIHGAGLQIYGGYTAPGFFTAGFAVNTTTYVGNEAWDNSGHTGEEIHADVMAMIEALQADNFTGPYRLYVPLTYWNKLQFDYKSATSGTIMERLTDGMGDVLSIRMSEHLPANRTLMLQLTSDVVDVVVGQQPTLLSWEDGPGFERYFMVLGCLIVRIKSNYLGNQGFVIGNTT